jgi:hypothetical protein
MTFFSVFFASYLGCSFYYWIKAIRESILKNTFEDDIDKKFRIFREQLTITRLRFIKKRNKENGSGSKH